MESNIPTAERKTGNPDPNIIPKMKSGKVVTVGIDESKLASYLAAGLKTGFTVKKIADEGEEFPWLSIKVDESGIFNQQYDSDGTRKVTKSKVVENYIAVSIEKPEDSKDHSPFWDNLRTLEQKKV